MCTSAISEKTACKANVPMGNSGKVLCRCRQQFPTNGHLYGIIGSLGVQRIRGNGFGFLDVGHYKYGHITTLFGNTFRSSLLPFAQDRGAAGDP